MWVNAFETERITGSLLAFFEPLLTGAPPDAIPYCCYLSTVVFYQRPLEIGSDGRYIQHDEAEAQWNLLGQRWTDDHVGFAALAPFVQHDGHVYELVGGQVIWRNGRWTMRWTARLVKEDDRRLVHMKSANVIDAPEAFRYDESTPKQGVIDVGI